MTANELRIGNLIIGTNVYEGKVLTFERFNSDLDVVFFSDGSKWDSGEFIEDIKPIQLTKEWLLKLGFIQQGVIINNNGLTEQCGINYFIKNNIVYSLSDNQVELDNPNVFLCNLKYVHQLQNLYFALTGEELTFKSE